MPHAGQEQTHPNYTTGREVAAVWEPRGDDEPLTCTQVAAFGLSPEWRRMSTSKAETRGALSGVTA